jgi:hypothetical protein
VTEAKGPPTLAETPMEIISVLTCACQILDVVKYEWSATNAWSDWDQSVRDRISAILKAYYSISKKSENA